MPKRVVDGDALWVSEKLEQVEEKFRVEYAWILPLSQGNGCFECSPMVVWRTAYAALRDAWTKKDVADMLDAFEAAKMLFRFKVEGKDYGFFPGMQKDGRLPKPSDRLKSAKQWQRGMVPAQELAAFLGVTEEWVEGEYGSRDVLATSSRKPRGHDDALVDDAVMGNANDAVMENVDEKVQALVDAKARSYAAASPADNTKVSPPSIPSSPTTLQKHTSPPQSASTLPKLGTGGSSVAAIAERFANMWDALMYVNDTADRTKIPKNWESSYQDDFKSLLSVYTKESLLEIIAMSQTIGDKGQAKFNVRPEALKKNGKLLYDNVERLKKDVKAWAKFVEWFNDHLSTAKMYRESAKTTAEGDED